MLFNSEQFLIFLPIVVLLYYVLPAKIKNYWLLFASYFFYMCWNAKYAVLIMASTVITYFSGLLISRFSKQTTRKWVMIACIVSNLGILFFFKYFNLGMSIIQNLFSVIHVQLNMPVIDVVLPVGISFYTFQALSYTIDVYRGDIYPEKNFFNYALFVSFFPQLVAGPIERSKNLLKQLNVTHKFSIDDFINGILLMIWGFFLKIVLADRVAKYVDCVYNNPDEYYGFYILIAIFLFAVQLYCDFYAYSVIAMGAARLLGIRLMENFDVPYGARSVSEFWRRWHISLSSWFKDYLYIPLGGNRKGKVRKYINIMIVFLTSGLWHGASISFVIWGGLNGLYQVVGAGLMPIRNKLVKVFNLNRESFSHKLYQTVVVYLLYAFSLVFFRAATTGEALVMLRQLFKENNIFVLFDESLYSCGLDRKNFAVMIIALVILLVGDILKYNKIDIRGFILRQEGWFKWIFVALCIWAIMIFGIWGPAYAASNFIYFQF